MCDLTNNPIRCTNYKSIIPHICAYYNAKYLRWKVMCIPLFKWLIPRVIIDSINSQKGTRLLSKLFFHCRSIWLHNLNSNKRCECVFGGIGCKPVLLLLWMFWIYHQLSHFLFKVMRLVWWLVDHICCVHNVLKLQWLCEMLLWMQVP
jgi:hypothetical protein